MGLQCATDVQGIPEYNRQPKKKKHWLDAWVQCNGVKRMKLGMVPCLRLLTKSLLEFTSFFFLFFYFICFTCLQSDFIVFKIGNVCMSRIDVCVQLSVIQRCVERLKKSLTFLFSHV